MMPPEQVEAYIAHLDSGIFGFASFASVRISLLPQGIWNANYLAEINGERFVLKVYGENVPGLLFGNKGKDEAVALRLLQGLHIAPEPVHFAYSPSLGKEVLIYRFVEGKQPSAFSPPLVKATARVLAHLHSLELPAVDLPRKKETMQTLLNDIQSTLDKCIILGVPEAELHPFRGLVEKAKQYVAGQEEMEHPFALVHGDLSPCNLIVDENNAVRIIDWQRPTFTDAAFDVWAFMEDAFIRWDLPEPLTDGLKTQFIKTYTSLVHDHTILERLRQKSPLYYLNIGLYCLMRYHEFLSGKIGPERTKGKEHLWKKYDTVRRVCVDRLMGIFL
ncbi:MAG TPA: phosphotransferase [Candidatus Nanoarchaeia archaeon]|nr:phosphotransferase [Candidatus Nanoarchaeia archaeon]